MGSQEKVMKAESLMKSNGNPSHHLGLLSPLLLQSGAVPKVELTLCAS